MLANVSHSSIINYYFLSFFLMSRSMCLISLLNDIDIDENVLTFAMEHGFLYDKQSDKVAQLVRNLWTTYLLEWQSMVPFGDVIKGVAENLLL